jgi:hypothetical protein
MAATDMSPTPPCAEPIAAIHDLQVVRGKESGNGRHLRRHRDRRRPGIAEARPWTNRRATDSSSVPARLAVVGGGGVAIEMATA